MKFIKSILMSSADPAKVALSVRGFLTSIIPILLIFNIGLTPAEIDNGVEAIVGIAMAGTAIIGSIQMLYGLARKIRLGRWTALK